MDLYLDTETFSELELKKVGAYRYSEECELLLLTYALDDEPVQAVDFTDPASAHALEQLQRDIDDADTVIIHNSAFDRQVLASKGINLPLEKIEDTMVSALRHSLPGKLDELCDVMKVPFDKAKDKDGKKLIQLFCKPRPKNMKLRRATRDTHPEEWQHFISYAKLDVDAMRYVRRELPRWNNSDAEQNLWRLDQKINDRGISVDVAFARAALGSAARASRSLAAAICCETDGVVESATQREKLLTYLRGPCEFDPGDLKGGTIAALLKTDLDPKVRRLLVNRKQAAATSPAKYQVLLNAVCRDQRIRGLLQYCGASRTGRWGGRLFQPQNLPRPAFGWSDIELGIAAIMEGSEDLLFDAPMELVSSAIRSALVAEDDKKLVIADLSNIEGRMLAWLADEQWKVKAFREFDAGIGHDLYSLAYARSFGVSPEAVLDNKKNGDGKMRQVGKVMELACLGPDTRVLTDVGGVRITEVTTDHKLWDGEQWVTHAGVIDRGKRRCVNFDGVELTADHLVLAGGSWLETRSIASSPRLANLARATGLVSLSFLASNADALAACAGSGSSARAERNHTAWLSATFAAVRARAARGARARLARLIARTGGATPPSFPMTGIAGACATVLRPACNDAATLATPGFTATAGAAYGCSRHGWPTGLFSLLTSSRCRAGMTHLSTLIASTWTGATSRAISVSSRARRTVSTSERCGVSKSECGNLRPVYDIAHAGPRNRFTILTDEGALVVHNCGYQGSVGAFNTMGLIYNVVLPDDEALAIVKAWRKAHPAIVSFWYDLDRKVKQAVREPGKTLEHGPIRLRVDHHWLRLRLPSGRYLSYPGVAVHGGRCTECNGDGFIRDEGDEWRPASFIVCDACEGRGRHPETIWFSGVNQYTRKWQRIQTYGGKLTENIVQAASRDVLAANMQTAEDKGYAICLHVHDELITETPDDPRFSSDELEAIMAANPAWSIGLPLAAGGYETHRYRKE